MNEQTGIRGDNGAAAVKTGHVLHLDRRKTASITGVTDVSSFDECEIVLRLEGGLMILTGQNMHISKLLLEEGKLEVAGQIDGITYETPGKFKRTFFAFGKERK